jgi:hypothetical protein
MSGAHRGGTRDRNTIERELRLLARVRHAHRENGGAMPAIDQMDALLDELIELTRRGKHRRDNETPDATSSLWR